MGIEVADRVLSADFLRAVGLEEQARLIEPVKRFLRGQDDTLAPRIANRSLLPEGERFSQLDSDHLEWSFGVAGTTDKAYHLATLFIEDIADHIRKHIDPHFDLVRYAEHLSNDAPIFDPLYDELQRPPSVVDNIMLQLLAERVESFRPERVCITIPFPGCLYGALRCGQWLLQHTEATVELGGGFPNTEWRSMAAPGQPAMRSMPAFVKPAARTARNAASASAAVWSRPIAFSTSSSRLCTPSEIRLTPPSFNCSRTRGCASSGCSSTVNSQDASR